ncbi:MAG: RNA 2',3'-cyclic phosphodiesterase [candidate division Zixibacteria bacterium]|nr:RNA 2',3'-cyclic phosphodiesterase [candidate division Zixibacteria bacterium]
MLRLFIALPLPHKVETELDQLLVQLRPKSDNVKWVPAKNIHLTVKFLGDTDEKLVDKITGAIDEIATQYQPLETTLDRIGAFPNFHRPRVIWIGGSEPIEFIDDLAQDIDHQMIKLHFEKEKRPFKPHLTLGRVRQGRRVDKLVDHLQTFELKPIPLTLYRVVLFKSTLTPKGAIYERLYEARLGEERFGG